MLGVFDTNFYRTLTFQKTFEEISGDFDRLRKHEFESEITAFLNPFVLLEVLSHLGDINDPAFKHCRNSVLAIFLHCTEMINGQIVFNVLADSESQICMSLFGLEPESHKRLTNQILAIAKIIAELNDLKIPEEIINDCRILGEDVQTRKARFVQDMQTHVLRPKNEKKDVWKPELENGQERKDLIKFFSSDEGLISSAHALVFKATKLLKIEISSNDMARKVDYLLKCFPLPLKMYNLILCRIFETGCDLSKKNRKNWMWDMQIGFSIGGPNFRVDDQKVALITDDKFFKESARAIKLEDSVFSISEYLNKVQVEM